MSLTTSSASTTPSDCIQRWGIARPLTSCDLLKLLNFQLPYQRVRKNLTTTIRCVTRGRIVPMNRQVLLWCYLIWTFPAMSTTSLKLPEDVKQLAVAAAKQQGITTHAFMVDAIRTAATNAERRAQFVADAVASRKEAVKSGKGYAADEVHAYLRAQAQGKSASKLKAKTWRA